MDEDQSAQLLLTEIRDLQKQQLAAMLKALENQARSMDWQQIAMERQRVAISLQEEHRQLLTRWRKKMKIYMAVTAALAVFCMILLLR